MRLKAKPKRFHPKRLDPSVEPEPWPDLHNPNNNNNSCNDNEKCEEITISEKPLTETGVEPGNSGTGRKDSARIRKLRSRLKRYGRGVGKWGYRCEEELEKIMLKLVDTYYGQALAKLVSLGYDEGVALRAILTNGYCYGKRNVVDNIVHHSMSYLKGENRAGKPLFMVLSHLEKYMLAGMVCLLRQVRPHLCKGDAMWCLLMCDLHVGRASVMKIQGRQLPSGDTCVKGKAVGDLEGVNNFPVGASLEASRSRGKWDSGNRVTSESPGFLSNISMMDLQEEIEYLERNDLLPSLTTLLKKDVAGLASNYREHREPSENHSEEFPSFLSIQDSSAIRGTGVESQIGPSDDSLKNQDAVNLILSKFRGMHLSENAENASLNQKENRVARMIHQIRDLQIQVSERREWAQQKAMQASMKVSQDLAELSILRMEREGNQCVKSGKPMIEDAALKGLLEMESAVRSANAQVEGLNAAIKKLEIQNAEIKASIEAIKLSTSESDTACLKVEKREKRYLNRILAEEKRGNKLMADIEAEKQNISELQQRLVEIEAAQKETEEKLKQEQKAKELALAQVEEESRLTEVAEANNKRRLNALRLKAEIDLQRHRDDFQRLHQELSHLKASAQSIEVQHQANSSEHSGVIDPEDTTITGLMQEFAMLPNSLENESSDGGECLLCMKDEVSVIFLPCAHQVVCAKCNENYAKKRKARCPCCRAVIEQSICVFGAKS